MSLLRIALTATAVLAVLAGCGDGSDKAAEALAEQALQAENAQSWTGPAVISFPTGDGMLRRAEGGDLTLPDDFPDDIHLPDDYTLVSVMTMGPALSLVMQSDQGLPRLYEHFQRSQTRRGWTETLSRKGTGGSMLGFEKGKRGLLVNLSSDVAGRTVVSLSVQTR